MTRSRSLIHLLHTVWRADRRLRFLVVGAYNTLFGYLSFLTLYFLVDARIGLLPVQIVAHVLSVSMAFIGHRSLTFRSSESWFPQFCRFQLSYLGLLVASVGLVQGMVHGLGIGPVLAGALSMVCTTAASYTLHARVSFRGQQGA